MNQLLEGYISHKVDELFESDEFKDKVAESALEYAGITVLRMQEGDVLVVPEDSTHQDMEILQRLMQTIGVDLGGIMAADIEGLGILREGTDGKARD